MEALNHTILVLGTLSLICLFVLHFISPEYKPSWRMISEYALGKHKWLTTLFFLSWGLASILVAIPIWIAVNSLSAKIGTILVFISGIGALMGGLYDVKHKRHGLAFLLGIPTLPIGAILIWYHLLEQEKWQHYKSLALWSTHSLWISVLFMGASMILLMSGYKKTGLPMGPGIDPPKTLPKGVVGVNGYFNRLLVVCYIIWIILTTYVMNSTV